MSIADKLQTILENEQKVYNAGYEKGKSEGGGDWYDTFWDAFQENGKRTHYNNAFVHGWDDTAFLPKYNLICTEAMAMFQYCKITKFASKLKELGLTFDVSACDTYRAQQMFQGSNIKDIPTLDLRNVEGLNYTFGTNSKVETIEKLILSNKLNNVTQAFGGASNLTHIIFEGELATTGLTMQDSKLLDNESIVSLIGILSKATSGFTVTLSKTAVNKAFETTSGANNGATSAEWLSLIDTKTNWNINLV